jgi:hypothetical protein
MGKLLGQCVVVKWLRGGGTGLQITYNQAGGLVNEIIELA